MEKPLFYSARLKINWADHHIRELIRVLNSFEQSGFHSVSGEGDAKTASEELTFDVTDELLEKIVLIISDAVHNLRTALDHVAHELVTRSKGTPDDSTKFPMGKTRQEAIAKCKGVIKGVCLDVVTCIVECIQPYPGGNGEVLYFLNALDNVDKHRLIIPIFSVIGYKFLMKDSDGTVVSYINLIPGGGKKTRTIQMPPGADSKSYRNPMLHILFDDVEGLKGRSVIKTLYEFREIVSAVVDEVERAYLGSGKLFSFINK